MKWKLASTRAYLEDSTDKTMANLRSLVRELPTYAPASATAAVAALAQGDYAESIKLSTKAIALGGDHRDIAWSYYNRACAHLMQHHYEDCVEDLNKALQLCPLMGTNPESRYLLRGNALARLGKYSRALSDFQMARRLNPKSFPAAREIWYCHYRMDKYYFSYQLSQELLQLERNELSYAAQALSLVAIGNNEKALETARQAVSLAPRNSDALHALAAAYVGTKEYQKALETYEQAIKYDPENFDPLLGEAYLLATCPAAEIRDGKAACALVAKAQRLLGPDSPLCKIALALAEAERGTFPKAIDLLDQVVKQEPPDSRVSLRCKRYLTLFRHEKPYRHGDIEP
jgi:tetratricopeptide (TPR) repeat protein